MLRKQSLSRCNVYRRSNNYRNQFLAPLQILELSVKGVPPGINIEQTMSEEIERAKVPFICSQREVENSSGNGRRSPDAFFVHHCEREERLGRIFLRSLKNKKKGT